jgi:hypothetical protein
MTSERQGERDRKNELSERELELEQEKEPLERLERDRNIIC